MGVSGQAERFKAVGWVFVQAKGTPHARVSRFAPGVVIPDGLLSPDDVRHMLRQKTIEPATADEAKKADDAVAEQKRIDDEADAKAQKALKDRQVAELAAAAQAEKGAAALPAPGAGAAVTALEDEPV